MCVYVCNFVGVYFKGKTRKMMIFHLFDSYQKGLIKEYGKEIEILNALNHRVMVGQKNKNKNCVLL